MRGGGQAEADQPGDGVQQPVRVFVSYAHDDAANVDRVREFWWFLRAHGIDARVDLPAAERRQDWAEWMTREVREADRVLVVVSPGYKRYAEGDAEPAEGRNVQWESRLIRDRFYADQDAGLQAVIPVVLPEYSAADIPLWLGPASATHYVVSEYTVQGAEKLLRLLTGQPGETDPPLGTVPVLPPRGAPDAFPGPPAPADARAASTAPIRSGIAGSGGIQVMVRVLAEVSSSLKVMRPSSSWTPERWRRESTGLRTHLAALGKHFGGPPSADRPPAGGVRQALQLNAASKEITDLSQEIGMSLDCLQSSASPPGARAREFNLFARRSAEFQRAALRLKDMLQAAEQAQESVVPGAPVLKYMIEEQPWYVASPPETDESDYKQIGNLRSRIDVVLITANETELLAVLGQLRPPLRRRKVLLVYRGPETYYVGRLGNSWPW